MAISLGDTGPNVTAGVAFDLGDETEQPVVTEPDVMDQWVWADPSDLPQPLFPATAAVLAAWRQQTAPEGWVAYPCTG